MKIDLTTPVLDAKGVPTIDAQTPVPDGKGGILFKDNKPVMQGGFSLLMAHLVTTALGARLPDDEKMSRDDAMRHARLVIKCADDHPDLTPKEIDVIKERALKTASPLHYFRLEQYLDSVGEGKPNVLQAPATDPPGLPTA